ncbi:MAG: hypothetical protein ABI847_04315 [Anaerolineales bacterium]
MADISAVFGILLTLGIAFPGLLTAWWLLFPVSVERARARLEQTPWRCFWLGGVATAFLVVPVVVLLALPLGPAKLAGWALILTTLAVASLGAAGLAARMGQRLESLSPSQTPLGAFVRGAVALELAAAFPVVGWFFFIPLTLVTVLGATIFALLHWAPRPASVPAAASQPVSAPLA